MKKRSWKKVVAIVLVVAMSCALCTILVACDKIVEGKAIKASSSKVSVTGNVKILDGDKYSMTHAYKPSVSGVYYITLTNYLKVEFDDDSIGKKLWGDTTDRRGNTGFRYVQLQANKEYEFKIMPREDMTGSVDYTLSIVPAQDTEDSFSTSKSYVWTAAEDGLGNNSTSQTIFYLKKSDAQEVCKAIYNLKFQMDEDIKLKNIKNDILKLVAGALAEVAVVEKLVKVIYGVGLAASAPSAGASLAISVATSIVVSLVLNAAEAGLTYVLNKNSIDVIGSWNSQMMKFAQDVTYNDSNKTKVSKVEFKHGIKLIVKSDGTCAASKWTDSTLSAPKYCKSYLGWENYNQSYSTDLIAAIRKNA